MSVAHSSAVGFRAELDGASLWDLVQMECLTRSRRVVRVTGEGGAGYLFFDAGRLVHAVTPRLAGEAAAMEILGWTHGAFQPCERAWPPVETIQTSCEALILQLAKRLDEQEGASNLVAFPGPAAAPVAAGGPPDPEKTPTMRRSIMNQLPPVVTPIASGEMAADFPVVLRLAASGAIVKNKGGTDDLADVVAYANRLVNLAGELLGLEEFVAMECTFTQGRCLMFAESNGETVALRPRAEANVQPLRERLGL